MIHFHPVETKPDETLSADQAAALSDFECASIAMLSAPEWNGSFIWWTESAKKVCRLGLYPQSREIFKRLVGY